MQLQQGNTKKSLENSRGFFQANAAVIGDAIPEAALRKLDDAIEGLSGHVSTQNAHTRAALGALNDRRTKQVALVRDHMKPIAKIAALELPNAPKLVAFTLPHKRASVQVLGGLATGMATAAAEHADVFIAGGLPADFADQLCTAAGNMLALDGEYRQNQLTSSQATSNLRTQLAYGRKVIHLLDAIMQSKFATNRGLLDAWNMAKRVQRKGVSSSATTPVTTPSLVTPAVPSASATSVAA